MEDTDILVGMVVEHRVTDQDLMVTGVGDTDYGFL